MPEAPKDQENMLTAQQAADLLGVPVRTFYDFRLPCYKYGHRCTRWDRADVEEYKRKCRFTSMAKSIAGDSRSIVLSTAPETGLLDSFRKAGVEPRPKRTTESKVLTFTPKRRASSSQPG